MCDLDAAIKQARTLHVLDAPSDIVHARLPLREAIALLRSELETALRATGHSDAVEQMVDRVARGLIRPLDSPRLAPHASLARDLRAAMRVITDLDVLWTEVEARLRASVWHVQDIVVPGRRPKHAEIWRHGAGHARIAFRPHEADRIDACNEHGAFDRTTPALRLRHGCTPQDRLAIRTILVELLLEQ